MELSSSPVPVRSAPSAVVGSGSGPGSGPGPGSAAPQLSAADRRQATLASLLATALAPLPERSTRARNFEVPREDKFRGAEHLLPARPPAPAADNLLGEVGGRIGTSPPPYALPLPAVVRSAASAAPVPSVAPAAPSVSVSSAASIAPANPPAAHTAGEAALARAAAAAAARAVSSSAPVVPSAASIAPVSVGLAASSPGSGVAPATPAGLFATLSTRGAATPASAPPLRCSAASRRALPPCRRTRRLARWVASLSTSHPARFSVLVLFLPVARLRRGLSLPPRCLRPSIHLLRPLPIAIARLRWLRRGWEASAPWRLGAAAGGGRCHSVPGMHGARVQAPARALRISGYPQGQVLRGLREGQVAVYLDESSLSYCTIPC
jgi:hypothetical protein